MPPLPSWLPPVLQSSECTGRSAARQSGPSHTLTALLADPEANPGGVSCHRKDLCDSRKGTDAFLKHTNHHGGPSTASLVRAPVSDAAAAAHAAGSPRPGPLPHNPFPAVRPSWSRSRVCAASDNPAASGERAPLSRTSCEWVVGNKIQAQLFGKTVNRFSKKVSSVHWLFPVLAPPAGPSRKSPGTRAQACSAWHPADGQRG